MAGFFETGGALDSLFDPIRSELGGAATKIQAWFHEKIAQDTDRYAIQRVLYVYAGGIKAGHYTSFAGYDDPQVPAIVAYIKARIAFDDTYIYNVLFALFENSKIDTDSAAVLAGSNGNFLDGLMNAGITNTVTDTLNDGLKGLGLPSVANSVVVVGVVGFIGLVIYLKVRR